jgi:hypothetical protein
LWQKSEKIGKIGKIGKKPAKEKIAVLSNIGDFSPMLSILLKF